MNFKLGFNTVLIALGSMLILSSCGDKGKKKEANMPAATATKVEKETTQGSRLAYVNADTLNKNYLYLKEKEDAFEKKQSAYESEMAGKEKALQNDYAALQKKAQAGGLSQADGEAAQKRLMQQQQALEQRHQTISAQLAKEQVDIQQEFQKKLDEFLAKFNENKQYDFIFTYSKNGGPILFANSALEITQEVLDAMNEDYKNGDKK